MAVPDFSSGSGKSGIWPFFGNTAKSSFGQISSRMPVQVQYVQVMSDKTNTADTCEVVYSQF